MIMLKITDVKASMQKLLYENETAFDAFLLSEAIIKMAVSYTIDGHINHGFYSREELDELREASRQSNQEFDEGMIRWKNIKSQVLSIVKGHKTPLSFSLVFYLSKENTNKFLSSIDYTPGSLLPSSLMLNIKYDGSDLNAITGTVYPSFTLDKSIDKQWDEMIKKFFNSHNIAFEELA